MLHQILERAGAFARPWVERSFVVITAAAILGAPVMVRAAATPAEIAVAAIDTKTTPSNVTLPVDADPTLVLNIQRRLAQLGLYLAAVDGRVTRDTTAAIRDYQRQARLKVDGAPSRALLEHLNSSAAEGQDLLQRLEAAREEQIAVARQTLEAHAPIRELFADVATFTEQESAAPTESEDCSATPTALCLVDEAYAAAATINKADYRGRALGDVAVARAAAGDGPAALSAAARLADPRLLIVALGRIAQAQADTGDYESALATARPIPDPIVRSETLSGIALTQHMAGNDEAARQTVSEALETAATIPDMARRVMVESEIAGVQAKTGDWAGAVASLDSALKQARVLETSDQRDLALSRVAAAMVETGQLGKALAIVATIVEARHRTPTLILAAAAQAESGDVPRAIETVASINEIRYQVVALEKLASAQARANDRAAALATLADARSKSDKILYSYSRAYGLSLIARAQAEIGAFGEALDTSAMIDNQALQARTLWTVAAAQARVGDTVAALRSETLALATANDIEDSLDRIWLLCDIAMARSNSGDNTAAQAMFDRAMGHTRALNTPWLRARALSRLAMTLVAMQRS